MVRTLLVAGNHKMNGSTESLNKLLDTLITAEAHFNDVDVIVAPPNVYLPFAVQKLNNHAIAVAAQNVSDKPKGAYTGEVSAAHLLDTKVPWVIVGHSERREHYHEDDGVIAKKCKAAIEAGLKVIFCCGETDQERTSGQTEKVVSAQLSAVKDTLTQAEWASLVIAYEPVWAIGDGKTAATPDMAQEVHQHIRTILGSISPEIKEKTRILYGGSVKAGNALELAKQPDIDGFLVGGASLVGEGFVDIIKQGKLGHQP